MSLVAVFLFLLRKSKNGGAIRRNMLFKDPVWDSLFVLYENGTVSGIKSDRSEFIFRSVNTWKEMYGDRYELIPVWVRPSLM